MRYPSVHVAWLVVFLGVGCGGSSPAADRDAGVVDAVIVDASSDAAVDAAPQLRRLTVTFAGQGGGTVTSGTLVQCAPTCVVDVLVGSTIELTATPNSGSLFSGWSGACSGANPTCTVVLDEDRSVVATFEHAPRTITVTRTGAGSGRLTNINPGCAIDCGTTCTAMCPVGTQLWIEAVADWSSRLVGWSACPGLIFGGYACEITVSTDATATAAFLLGHIWGSVGADRGIDVAVAPDGSTYLVGRYEDDITFGTTTLLEIIEPQGFIVKLSGNGFTPLWAKAISEATHDVIVDGAGNAITAVNYDVTNPDPYPTVGYSWMVQRYQAGTGTRDQSIGGAGDAFIKAIAVDGNGNVAVVGTFIDSIAMDGTLITSAGSGDIFVGKIDGSTWTLSWLKRYGSTGNDEARAVTFDGSGNIWVTGFFHDSTSLGGTTFMAPPLTSHGFLAQYDGATGAHIQSRALPATSFVIPEVMSIASTGNIRIAGHLKGTGNFGGGDLLSPSEVSVFGVEVDITGTHVSSWTTAAGNPAYSADQFALDSAGNVLLTRSFYNTVQLPAGTFTSAGSSDMLVMKFAAGTGTMMWATSAGGSLEDEARGIALDNQGRPIVAGGFRGSGPFGAGTTLDYDVVLFPVPAP